MDGWDVSMRQSGIKDDFSVQILKNGRDETAMNQHGKDCEWGRFLKDKEDLGFEYFKIMMPIKHLSQR